jgi:hypothetical protein
MQLASYLNEKKSGTTNEDWLVAEGLSLQVQFEAIIAFFDDQVLSANE